MAQVVKGIIPNLINGVSQQAPALRLSTQAEAQERYYSTIVEGLKDGPPTEFVAKLLDTLPDNIFTHIINRDVNERYLVLIDETPSLRVFGFDGVERTVNAPDGFGYLSATGSVLESSLHALTVADYTFIANSTKVVAMASDVAEVRKPEALVNVMAGNYGKTYTIKINNTEVASYATPDGHDATTSPQVDTVFIASELASDLATNGYNDGTTWQTTRYGNALHIQNLAGTNFEITVEDGYNGNAMKAVKDRTQHFGDLPLEGPDGFVAEVVGDQSTAFDNYWVKFETQGSGTGVWKETLKPGVKLKLDKTTMPHTLIREADGTFTFDCAEWDERKCGDEEISPDPTFVGSTIEDVGFHRNRLGFLSDENAILSRNGSFFDFFRTSATALLDDDPIDVSASHVKVSLLKHAVPFQDDLLVFSEQTQFSLQGNEMLTPKTVSLRPRTEYVCDPAVAPLALGTSVFFTAKRGDWTAVWEYSIDQTTATAKADEITSHVPSYIPGGAYKLIGTSNENVIVALTKGDPAAIYPYKFYWSGNEKLQSAWSRWSIPNAIEVLDAEFVESDLMLVVKRSDGVYLEKMRAEPSAFDEGIGFLVHLDQRVHSDQLAAPTYDSNLNRTTYTLPYTPREGIWAVTSEGGSIGPANELFVEAVDEVGKTVTLKGDTRTVKFWFGFTYERRFKFSRFYLRTASQGGGQQVVQTGRLQVRYMNLSYNKTASFRVEVTPQGRKTYVYPFTGRTLGSDDFTLGEVPLASGKKNIPIQSRNDRVTIEIIADSWMPSSFISVEWFGSHTENSREL